MKYSYEDALVHRRVAVARRLQHMMDRHYDANNWNHIPWIRFVCARQIFRHGVE